MARQSFDYTHGDTGTKPGNPLDFAKGERPQAQQFDWYWYNVTEAISGHANEFDRLDKNDDGIVDESDTVTAGGNLKGNLNDAAGNRLYNDSGNYVEQERLENDSVTVNPGTGIASVGTVALGASVTVDVDTSVMATRSWATGSNILHGELADAPAAAHHTRYVDEEAQDAVAAILTGGNKTNVTYDDAGNVLTVAHADTSTQGSVATGGATVIGDIDVDDNGHVTGMVAEDRTIDDWTNSGDSTNNSVDADTVDGSNVFVQSTKPSGATAGDIWIDTS